MPSEVRKVQLSEQRRSSARQTHWHVWRLKVRQTEIARAILSANRKPTKLSAMGVTTHWCAAGRGGPALSHATALRASLLDIINFIDDISNICTSFLEAVLNTASRQECLPLKNRSHPPEILSPAGYELTSVIGYFLSHGNADKAAGKRSKTDNTLFLVTLGVVDNKNKAWVRAGGSAAGFCFSARYPAPWPCVYCPIHRHNGCIAVTPLCRD
uniref:SFRICE_017370 n=1 Tax=Spodoptera frugiperda TaxID=7108 RepID=A0A2H1WG79_SPOFR